MSLVSKNPSPALVKPATEVFPAGLHNIYFFVIFNALSYQLILSSPMVLYAKSLGASATVLGIISGMMPLLVIFQIPASKHLARIGYKRFVFAGWGTRTLFIFGMALVPLTGKFLDATTRLSLMLLLLFVFNLARGISSCAWMPWITSLIPTSLRGRYLVRDAACQNIGSLVVFLIAAICLGAQPEAWRFALLFGFSAMMAAMSLNFLRRVPEAATPAEVKTSTTPVPWRAIATYSPFRKLIFVNIAWSVAIGGMNTFIVDFLKAKSTLTEREIMLTTSVSFLGGLSSLWFLGSRLDRLRSKTVLTFFVLAWLSILCGWILIAGKIFAPLVGLVLCLQFVMGLSSSLANMAMTRLAMAVIPPMGRNHFFALYSVLGNVTLGLSPIFWGLFLDGFRSFNMSWHGLEWNRFSLFFLVASLVFMVALIFCRRLEEPQAASMEELVRDILEQSPLRPWLRFWPRS